MELTGDLNRFLLEHKTLRESPRGYYFNLVKDDWIDIETEGERLRVGLVYAKASRASFWFDGPRIFVINREEIDALP